MTSARPHAYVSRIRVAAGTMLVVGRIEQLERVALDSEHGERARVVAQDVIGSVRVIEEGEHIIAEIHGGRLLMQGAGPDVTYGA